MRKWKKLIPDGLLKAGHTYFIGRGISGMIGVFKIEVESTFGNGKFTTSGIGSTRDTREVLKTAFNYFKANKKNISATIQTDNIDYLLHIILKYNDWCEKYIHLEMAMEEQQDY